jgi:hypothetical protein
MALPSLKYETSNGLGVKIGHPMKYRMPNYIYLYFNFSLLSKWEAHGFPHVPLGLYRPPAAVHSHFSFRFYSSKSNISLLQAMISRIYHNAKKFAI